MREILFKAKWKRDGRWVEGLPTIMRGEYHIVHKDNENLAYPIIEDTICQYTGLTDKNGKKIWENDVVKDCCIFGQVVWDKKYASFVIDDVHDGYQDYSEWWHELEVIGNIFDNPELLKGGAE